jgi:hypothetical protein
MKKYVAQIKQVRHHNKRKLYEWTFIAHGDRCGVLVVPMPMETEMVRMIASAATGKELDAGHELDVGAELIGRWLGLTMDDDDGLVSVWPIREMNE